MADGYFNSDDLALLKEIFEESRERMGAASDSPAANDLAKALMVAFESGTHDKDDLLAIVDYKNRRKVG